jgi:hypothetical protein
LVSGLPQTPDSSTTQFLGINNRGVAVAFYLDANSIAHGIRYDVPKGTLTYIDDPHGVLGTVLNGINNSGDIVGFYTDGGTKVHGILVTGAE